MNKKLKWDAENVEQVVIETANKRELRYVYALAVAMLHVIEWIARKDKNE